MKSGLSLCLMLLVLPLLAGAATPREQRIYESAVKAYNDTQWERAARELGEFVEKYPASDLRPEAVLYQAQARSKTGDYSGAIALLESNLEQAGEWRDRYIFLLGKCRSEEGNYEQAARDFSRVIEQFPNSTHRLEAAFEAAAARFELGQWPAVIEQLSNTNGFFQQALRTVPNHNLVIRGLLLLGEAHLAQGQREAVRDVLAQLDDRGVLAPELAWRRQFLLLRLEETGGAFEAALSGTTNLIAQANLSGKTGLRAESVVFRAGLLERLGRPNEAVATYESNLLPDVSEARRRQALLKVIDLRLAQDELALATTQLDQFLTSYPADPVADLALLTLGEVLLKSHVSGQSQPTNAPAGPAQTNGLQRARTYFSKIISDYPKGKFVPAARLDLGWCYWQEQRYAAAQEEFAAAATTLTGPAEQALARFKWADAQFQLENFTSAITNYEFVVDHYRSVPEAEQRLVEPALYQLVQSGRKAGDNRVMTDAVEHLLEWYPNGFFTDRSLLVAGRGLNDRGDPAQARKIFSEFENTVTNSILLPEVRLAIARTYERQQDWPAAIRQYDAWREQYPRHPAAARALYNQAWAYDQGGQPAKAFNLFTNLVATFPEGPLAPLAQYWIGVYYFSTDQRQDHYVNAERTFQELYQKWPAHDLAIEAQMMAGKSAYARQGWLDARRYFLELIKSLSEPARTPAGATNDSAPLLAEANFALGDAIFRQYLDDPGKPLDKFREAIAAFRFVVQNFPTNRIAIRAQGRIGDCNLQPAAQDPTFYEEAKAAYQKVIDSPHADVAARSQAKVGLGTVSEKLAALAPAAKKESLLKEARDHYLDVVYYDKFLRDQERIDPFWFEKAGMEAGRLSETLRDWDGAAAIYKRLLAEPEMQPVQPVLEEAISRVQKRMPAKGG